MTFNGGDFCVSIRLMTYNHASFIDKTMDSILAQKTNFRVELIVGDDFSTDDTLEIVRSYSNTENIVIKILDRPAGGDYSFNRRKFGRLYNYVNILENCSGKYVAIIDGDDYWSDPYKLQKQVNFLEINTHASMCCHRVKVLTNGKVEDDGFDPGEYDLAFIIGQARVGHTPSYLFRNYFRSTEGRKALDLFINRGIVSGDRVLQLILGMKGKIVLINEFMAVYRKHEAGIMNSRTFQNSHNIGLYRLFKYFDAFSSFAFREFTGPTRRKWLEITLKNDIHLGNKLSACFYAFSESINYGIMCLFRLPFYFVKALLFRLKSK